MFEMNNFWAFLWSKAESREGVYVIIFNVLLLSLLAILCFIKFNKSSNNAIILPPGPRGLPVVGYLPFLKTNLHHQFVELYHRYGDIFKLWLGSRLCIVVNTPSLAKQIVRDHDALFANRDSSIAAMAVTYGGIDIVWSPHGSYWRAIRKLFVREMLGNSNLDYNLREKEIRKTISEVYSKIGSLIDIGEIAFNTQLNTVMSMVWGNSSKLRSEEMNSKLGMDFRDVIFKIVIVVGTANVSDFFPVLSMFDLQGLERKAKKLLLRADKIFDAIFNEHLKLKKDEKNEFLRQGKKDFLDILLEIKEQKKYEIPIDNKVIKAMLMDIILGGTDTSATTIEWAMTEIVKNPEILKKVQEELTDIVGTKDLVEDHHFPNLHYLEAVVKETFRLHPALPLLIPRCSSQSCTVGGYTIPEGTRALVNIWAIQTDPQVWDKPLEFRPERFLEETNRRDFSGNNFDYLPFGSGRRICAGIPMAEKIIIHQLASLLHLFDWKLPTGEDLDTSEKFGIVMKKKTPLVLIPSQRLSNLQLYM